MSAVAVAADCGGDGGGGGDGVGGLPPPLFCAKPPLKSRGCWFYCYPTTDSVHASS